MLGEMHFFLLAYSNYYFIGQFFHTERKCISEAEWFNAKQQMSHNLSLSNVN